MSLVAIIGAGLIGRAWANVFARGGFEVRVWDPDAGVRAAAHAAIAESLADLARHGLVTDPAAAAARVTVVDVLEDAVRAADLVQENGPERLDVKKDLFARLDAATRADAILASSTSAIVASKFTEDLVGRGRCIVAHPVNPPHVVPIVELCGAPWTTDGTKQRAREIYASVGQVPIEVKKEIDGFILNRLQIALLTEAFRLVQEGYVSPKDLDHTIADGLGLRWAFMGPFETIELNAPNGIADYCRRYGDWFRRYMQDVPPASVWADGEWQKAADAWGPPADPKFVTAKSRWRDERLAALAAHKKGQRGFE
jgi:3-hydroxyacyl-CoA dehydrogenase